MRTYNFERVREDSYNELEKKKKEMKYINRLNFKIEKEQMYIRETSNKEYDNLYNIYDEEKLYNLRIHKKSIDKFSSEERNEKKLINLKVLYCEFKECRFENIEFIGCIFIGNVFLKCDFENVIFKDCKFYNEEDDINIFKDECKLREVRFNNSNIEKIKFENIGLKNVYIKESNLNGSIFNKCIMKEVIICDSDLSSIKILRPKHLDISFEDYYLSKFDEHTFIDKVDLKKKDKNEYIDICKVYKDISTKFEANRLSNIGGEYYYIAKLIEKNGLKGIAKLKSMIYWALCGYGERPTYALITSLEIVLVFAILYMITGLNIGGELVNYKSALRGNVDVASINKDFINSLYFSIVTFTTVGYGDITPVGFFSTLLSAIEMLLGVTMVGIWTATLSRKITK
ncbi:ion channel [Romboutsia hominis]|uniref:Ion channel n=1 Tax=Romboutsia hominis TaxID=1507512 RepID=A0A2P2BPD3_9FIRM|nr:ion channel [Romboutsia hominis]CEI72220.1 Ion channel [Romboutsia hominis]